MGAACIFNSTLTEEEIQELNSDTQLINSTEISLLTSVKFAISAVMDGWMGGWVDGYGRTSRDRS